MLRPEYGIWRRGARVARANGRSLIYEPGAAPPPCHNRVPGARARPPAARRLALSPASDGEWCARSHASAPHSVLRPSRVAAPRVSRECSASSAMRRPWAASGHHAARQALLRPPRLHRYLTLTRHLITSHTGPAVSATSHLWPHSHEELHVFLLIRYCWIHDLILVPIKWFS